MYSVAMQTSFETISKKPYHSKKLLDMAFILNFYEIDFKNYRKCNKTLQLIAFYQ